MGQPSFDAYREDVAGRANVADTPELVAYYQRLAQLGAPADHPMLAAHPEGEYLSGLLVRVAEG